MMFFLTALIHSQLPPTPDCGGGKGPSLPDYNTILCRRQRKGPVTTRNLIVELKLPPKCGSGVSFLGGFGYRQTMRLPDEAAYG